MISFYALQNVDKIFSNLSSISFLTLLHHLFISVIYIISRGSLCPPLSTLHTYQPLVLKTEINPQLILFLDKTKSLQRVFLTPLPNYRTHLPTTSQYHIWQWCILIKLILRLPRPLWINVLICLLSLIIHCM